VIASCCLRARQYVAVCPAIPGYEDLTLEDLCQFRQWESKLWSPRKLYEPWGRDYMDLWVKALPMASELVMAEAHLAATFNKPDFPIIDHYNLCDSGDGDNMEGVPVQPVPSWTPGFG